jgi:hypothetical protein
MSGDNLQRALEGLAKNLSNIDWDESFYLRRLPEFETYDDIRLTMTPRWKDSYMSGSE